MIHNINFYGEELLAPHPTPNLEDYPFLAVHDCLFNIKKVTKAQMYPSANLQCLP